MKIHRPIAEQVVSALRQTFGEGYHADKVIERLFKNNRKLGSRDRKFIAEATYDCVRWWRLLFAGLGLNQPNLEERTLWQIVGVWLIYRGADTLPAWDEFRGLSINAVRKNLEAAQSQPAVRESVPDWLYELGAREFGEQKWQEILPELNKQAPAVLRANRLKTDRDQLRKALLAEEIETTPAPEAADGLILKERKNVFTTEAFKKGLFEVQDGSSQQVVPLLLPEPGQRVIDACAGAGGKTLHIASLMKNKGKIISMDIHQRKLDELRKRCTRNGVDIVETKVIESTKSVKRLEKTADRVLLDVPCTGIGVLRRNPDSKWKLKPEDVERLIALQAEILENYSEMVKPGGRLVYATCSILPSENTNQVEKFMSTRQDTWKLITERKFWPGENGYDGFYAAALERLK